MVRNDTKSQKGTDHRTGSVRKAGPIVVNGHYRGDLFTRRVDVRGRLDGVSVRGTRLGPVTRPFTAQRVSPEGRPRPRAREIRSLCPVWKSSKKLWLGSNGTWERDLTSKGPAKALESRRSGGPTTPGETGRT